MKKTPREVLLGALDDKRAALTPQETAAILGAVDGDEKRAVLAIVNSGQEDGDRFRALVDYFGKEAATAPAVVTDYRSHLEAQDRARAEADVYRSAVAPMLVPSGSRASSDERRYPYGAAMSRMIRPDKYEGRAPVSITSVGGVPNAPVSYDVHQNWLDLITESSAVLQAGFTFLRTDRTAVQVPMVSADAPAGAKSGEFDDLTDGTFSGMDAAALTVTPVAYASYEKLSNEVVADAHPSLLDAFSRGVARRHALSWVNNIITEVQTNGTAVAGDSAHNTSFDKVSDALSAIEAAGGDVSRAIIITTPTTVAAWRNIKEASGSTVPTLLGGNGAASTDGPALNLFGARIYAASGVTANKCLVLDPAQVVCVVRNDPRVKVSEEYLFGEDATAFAAISRFQSKVVSTNVAAVRVLTDS